MRLIDADKFANDEYLEKRYGTDFYWEFRKRLDMQPTVDVLEQIRAEIDELDTHYDNDYFSGNRDAMFKCNDVLEVIDKYR